MIQNTLLEQLLGSPTPLPGTPPMVGPIPGGGPAGAGSVLKVSGSTSPCQLSITSFLNPGQVLQCYGIPILLALILLLGLFALVLPNQKQVIDIVDSAKSVGELAA